MVDGGAERADSVAKALARVKPEIDFVCVHDAARPCLADEWIDDDLRGRPRRPARRSSPFRWPARSSGSAPITRSRRRSRARACGKPRRRRSFAAQLLLEAYAKRGDFQATDDAQLVERIGHPVTVVPGSPINLKIATREDLRLAEQALKALPKPKLAGPGHPFADDDMWR